MEKLKGNYLLIVVIISVLAIAAAYYANQFGFTTEQVATLTNNGEKTLHTTIKSSTQSLLLNILSTFLFTLAISIFISIFVANRLETALAEEKKNELKRFNEAININVFDSLFQRLIPKEIFDVFKSDVISNRIVRRDANWIYDFKEVGDSSGKIELVQTVKYQLNNISHEQVDDAVSAIFDGKFENNGLRRAVCMFEGKPFAEFSSEDIKNATSKTENVTKSDDGKVTITRTADGHTHVVMDVSIPAGRSMDVTLVYVSSYENYYVNDGYFTKYPMINATLTATYPESYDFEIFQALSSELKRTLKEPNRSIYEVKGGILPHQGFIYKLQKKA